MSTQHLTPCKRPCKSCPWRRDSRAGGIAGPEGPGLVNDGEHTWQGMMAQAHGPFWLPCHSAMDTEVAPTKQDSDAVIPCIGAGIYRTHVRYASQFITPLTPVYPADPETVFTSPIEFLQHHMKLTKPQAVVEFYRVPLIARVGAEFKRAADRGLFRAIPK